MEKSIMNEHHGDKTIWWGEPEKTKHKNLDLGLVSFWIRFLYYIHLETLFENQMHNNYPVKVKFFLMFSVFSRLPQKL